MSDTQSTPIRPTQIVALVASVGLSIFVGFYAQASAISSAAYVRLFWFLLPFAVIDVAAIAFVRASKAGRKIWFVGVPAVVGFASYIEMACRVWFGIHLL